jgi:O-antigen/teichoic acid export membrane protein
MSNLENQNPTKSAVSAQDESKQVSKGLFVITAAKLWFMVGGALITFGLPYLFNAQGKNGVALYGQYNDLNNTLSILTMVIVTGGMQTISKFTSQAQNEEQLSLILKKLFWLMLGIGSALSIGFILSADQLAQMRGNADLVMGYRFAGLVLLAYSIYIVFIGALNGRKAFGSQALFDIGFTTLKAILVLGLAFVGLGVNGAFLGFALSAILIAIISFLKVGFGKQGSENLMIQTKDILSFAFHAMLYTLVFNLIFKLDILLIKPVLQTYTSATSADTGIGLYGMAVNLSRLPWQATIAVTFVIFPILSEATFGKDLEKARIYISQSLRYLGILIGGASAVLMAYPEGVTLFLPKGYQFVADLLIWLAPAYFCFSLFNLVNTILISANYPNKALIIGVATTIIASLLYYFWMPMGLGTLDPTQTTTLILTRGAQATFIAFAFGLSFGVFELIRIFGKQILAIGSVLRVIGVLGSFALIGVFMPLFGKILSLVILGGLGILYFVLLALLGEFNAEDRARFQRIIRRKNRP